MSVAFNQNDQNRSPVLTEAEATAMKIYAKGQELRLTTLKTKREKEALKAIAITFGLKPSVRTMKKLYLIGEELTREQEKEKQNRLLTVFREAELRLFEAQKARTETIGKEKYRNKPAASRLTTSFVCAAERADAAVQAKNTAALSEVVSERYQAKTASAILACGDAALKQAKKALSDYSYGRDLSEQQLAQLETKFFDNGNLQKNFAELTIENVECKMTSGKNFTVQANIDCPAVVDIFGKPAILDGTLCAVVKNKKGAIVAEGFFAPPGAGCADLTRVGFASGITFYAMCVSPDPDAITFIDTYTCEILPASMWKIEL